MPEPRLRAPSSVIDSEFGYEIEAATAAARYASASPDPTPTLGQAGRRPPVSRETAPPSTRSASAAVAAGAPANGAPARPFGLRGNLGALRHPLYRRYWLGSLGSVGGTQFVTLASGWLVVFELGGSRSTSATSAARRPYRRSSSTSSAVSSPTA